MAEATVTAVTHLDAENTFLTFKAPPMAALAKPGQFVEIKTPFFLNRPFGIAYADKMAGTISIGVREVGAGTRYLKALAPGDTLTVIGPLGHGFDLRRVERAYVIGGGSGIYPLLFLLEALEEKKIAAYTGCGFRSASDIVVGEAFKLASDAFLTACELPGGDLTGTALDALDELYRRHGPGGRTVVFACGPIPMLKAINLWCEANNVPAQMSFEARMGCGYGICRGCAIPCNVDGETTYLRCCLEGPVFPHKRIAWEVL